jgi:glutaredoxin-related protein
MPLMPRSPDPCSPGPAQILTTMGVPFESVNILDNELLRSGMKE